MELKEETVQEHPKKSQDVFEKYLVGTTFRGEHTMFKFTDIVMDLANSTWDALQTWQMFSLSSLNLLLTPYYHTIPNSNIPIVHSVAFRLPPAPLNSPHCVFKIHMSNISEMKGYWSIFNKPPKGWTKHLHHRVNCVNCGMSEFKDGHFVDSPDVTAQIWAKKFNYTSSTAHRIPLTCNSIKDMTLFDISPTSGCLKGKDSDVITIKYFYTWIGHHEMSILLRIFPAIFVWIDVRGNTLDLNQPHIQLMHEKNFKLHPICLSDLDPPIQMFHVYNGGNSVASFTVDLEPFEKLKDENFGHSVISCLTAKGEVPPRSWFPIKIKFSPLEFTPYSVPLKIYPSYDKVPLLSMVSGNASINPVVSLRPTATVGTIRKFALFAHGVPVTMSPSHVCINHLIPTGHSVTRIVFLTNYHVRNTMKYSWQNLSIEGGGMISFHPNCGRLAPKEEVSCKIKIKAGNTTAVFSEMIVCTIEDETANVIYEFVLSQWRDYMKNKQLRDNEPSSPEVTHKPEKPETCNRLLAVSLYIGSTFGQYDTLQSKEKSRMSFVDPLKREHGQSPCEDTFLPFTHTGSELCQSLLADIIWDVIQAPSFPSFTRIVTKRKAPLFEEYAEAESANEGENSPSDCQDCVFPIQSTSEVMEKAIFNIMHEMAERYAHTGTRAKWAELPAVQPKALIDVEKHKKQFQL